MIKPIKEQQAVIDSQEKKIKVSANAGSGKTFTIMHRIAKIIELGKKSNNPITLDQLLVLTFTEASARDMRRKLKEQLGSVIAPVEIQAASIGTFHSFCASIVRAWFTVAEVSPSFTVMDAVESEKIKYSIFDKVVLEHYQDVARVVDLFAATRTLDNLREVVFEIHNFLESREDRDIWLQNTALAAYDSDLERNPAIQALLNYYRKVAEKYLQYFIETGEPSPYLDSVVTAAKQIMAAKTYEDFTKLKFVWPEVKRGALTKQPELKKLHDKFKEQCYKMSEQFKYSATQVQKDIQEERVVVESLLRLIKYFEAAYDAKKNEYKKLDFNDLEKYALKVLANDEALGAIRAQYKYIFVDEGQDTNPVQYKIIDILRGEDKFFCIVGDVKQSIYGFRMCEPEIFEKLKDEDGNLVPVLLLGRNFRSVNPILHFVNMVMEPLIPEYAEKHAFTEIGERDCEAMKQAVTIEIGKDAEAQKELVYQRILAAQKETIEEEVEENGQKVVRKVPLLKHGLQDIVVLSETNSPMLALQKYLIERGIPTVIDRKTDALIEPEVFLLNQFLFAAMNPMNELPRYIVLQHLFGCSNDELAQVRLEKMSSDLTAKIATYDAVLDKYRQLGREASTYEVLTQVATEFGMLELPAVNAFLMAIRGVHDFDTVARYLYLVEHDLVKIEINVGANAKNAVRLMTIHNSKGLEFRMVILYNMGLSWAKQTHDNSNVKVAYDKNMGICISSVDTKNYVLRSPALRLGIKKYQAEIDAQEKIRLLYVALTRVQKRMTIIGCRWKRNSYLIRPDSMLDLINPLGATIHDDIEPSSIVQQKQVTNVTQLELCPQMTNSEVLVKQSVTALATAAEPLQDYVAPNKFKDDGGKDFGTAFHKQMQYGDLPTDVQNLVNGYTVYRELPFLYLQNQTIVQGIMDLLAVKNNEAIIVDYKTTRLPVENLITKYREQLRLYAEAIPGYQVRAYIYSTVHKKLIEVSF